MSRISTKFSKFLASLSIKNVKGLCLLFVCIFGALAIVLVPVLTNNVGAGTNNQGDNGDKDNGNDNDIITQIYVERFILASNITITVGQVASDALLIDDRRAIVEVGITYGEGRVEFSLDGIGIMPLVISGVSVGEARINVTIRVRQQSGDIENVTRVLTVRVI